MESMRLTRDEANDATSDDEKGAKSGGANGGSGRKWGQNEACYRTSGTDDERDENN